MSRFAKVNLLEVEDSVAGRVEGLEGRFGREHLDSRDLGVSLFDTPRTSVARWPTATRSRRRPTSSPPAPVGSSSTTRSTSSGPGMSSGSRPRSSEHLRPVPMGWTSSPWAAPSPRRVMAFVLQLLGPTPSRQAGCSTAPRGADDRIRSRASRNTGDCFGGKATAARRRVARSQRHEHDRPLAGLAGDSLVAEPVACVRRRTGRRESSRQERRGSRVSPPVLPLLRRRPGH